MKHLLFISLLSCWVLPIPKENSTDWEALVKDTPAIAIISVYTSSSDNCRVRLIQAWKGTPWDSFTLEKTTFQMEVDADYLIMARQVGEKFEVTSPPIEYHKIPEELMAALNALPCYDETVTHAYQKAKDPSTPDGGCLRIYSPVCGCDSVTYSNSCEATRHHGIVRYSMGKCK
jgi:hypothetical protein